MEFGYAKIHLAAIRAEKINVLVNMQQPTPVPHHLTGSSDLDWVVTCIHVTWCLAKG